jgi:hypothetical protein
MLVLLAAVGMLLNVAKREVWRPLAPVKATMAPADRRGRRRPAPAARAPRAVPRPPEGRLREEAGPPGAHPQRPPPSQRRPAPPKHPPGGLRNQ